MCLDSTASPHYPGGLALRFARVKRYRMDKSAAQADTIELVRAIAAGARIEGRRGDAP
jgi:DNA ligase-1